MKLLLDTHTLIWWDSDPAQLSPRVLSMCQDPTNQVIISVVSVWEMQIKIQLGKMKVASPLAHLVEQQVETNGFDLLPIALPHVLRLDLLPLYHKDPFDRLLVAQALEEDAAILSRDSVLASYPVQVIW